ncbi:SRPBCC family protein [Mucilaginibacter paludis]|uniref:SRPBCC family protein n=1 Tax=Mucilaginibacter paludis DSM 18603 TaxID=714943 RepID=H1Y0D4_9SPHI|nr:hypothetical protein [Mucilaginibacter paludis]EHQ28183.1 hypothetical protein Mucpa_4092 [Mucilaginibacter paludis DSM 18603]
MDNRFLSAKQMGFIVPNAMAFTLIGLSKLFFNDHSGATVLAYSEFIIIPLLMGILSAYYWRNLDLRGKTLSWYSCVNSFYAIVLSTVFLGEGMICLIIVSPLIFGFVITGAFLGKEMFKRRNQNLNISIITLLTFIFIADSRSKHEYSNMVSDSLIVNATPDKIWKNVVAFEPIRQKNNYWLFQIGMPSPMATTVTGYYQGAGRKCIFSNGYVFGEKIVTYNPGKDLTFDIVNQPRDPEIMGHIDILRGQFLLHDNGNGTTTLIGNSWYKLYVFPVWYYDVWAQSITRNVHLRVMEHIKQLSEAK